MSESPRQQSFQDQKEVLRPPEIQSWRSDQLLGEATEARIIHGNEVYRLLRTRNDKLILVK